MLFFMRIGNSPIPPSINILGEFFSFRQINDKLVEHYYNDYNNWKVAEVRRQHLNRNLYTEDSSDSFSKLTKFKFQVGSMKFRKPNQWFQSNHYLISDNDEIVLKKLLNLCHAYALRKNNVSLYKQCNTHSIFYSINIQLGILLLERPMLHVNKMHTVYFGINTSNSREEKRDRRNCSRQ